MADSSHDSLVAQLVDIAHVQPSEAQHYLESSNWDLNAALELVYEHNTLDTNDHDDEDQHAPPPASASAAAVASSSSSSSSMQRRAAPARRFATLRDVKQGEEDDHHHGGGHGGDSDDDDAPQDMFAGGEKSGLAVQNPDDLKKKIIEKAKQSIAAAAAGENPTKKSNFTGSARTLGGDDTPSKVIPDPSAPAQPSQPARVHRVLNFWSNGFSVDDGALYDTSNPRNAEILNQIRHGRAPLSIMNVDQNQEVDVEIVQHAGEYVPPKKKFVPFAGTGHRLGSPTPGIVSSAPAAGAGTGAGAGAEKKGEASAAESNTDTAAPQVDESQPILTLQIRLGDGSRIVGRFNATHTVGDVYEFVAARSSSVLAPHGSQGRDWVLMTTFPSKKLEDKGVALGDLEGYKRGGVLVQKWE